MMFVFSNLATSLDGKIAIAGHGHLPLGTEADWKEMQRLRRKADCILYGATTLRDLRKTCRAQGAKRQPINAVFSSRLEGLSPDWDFFKDAEVTRVLFCTSDTTPRRLAEFRRSCFVHVLAKPAPGRSYARQMIEVLERMGVKRLLVEGGGTMMWEFVSNDLIDEYHITHVPRLLGGTTAPTLVQGPGLTPETVVNVKLASCKKVGSELYLVYRRTGVRGLPRARATQLVTPGKTTDKNSTLRSEPKDRAGSPGRRPKSASRKTPIR